MLVYKYLRKKNFKFKKKIDLKEQIFLKRFYFNNNNNNIRSLLFDKGSL